MMEKDTKSLTEETGKYEVNNGFVPDSESDVTTVQPKPQDKPTNAMSRINRGSRGSQSSSVTEKEIEDDMRCGLGSCKPDCLQTFNNPKAVLLWLCWLSFLQGFMVNGINNVNTSTLERRFQLSSSQAGVISSSYDISAAILAIPVSYFGAHAHQPRMLTFAALIMAVGAFTMTIPHFATGPYDLINSQADQCLRSENSTTMCVNSDSNISNWLGILLLGMIFNGMGGTTLYSVGIVFLDTCVGTASSPLYQGFLYSSATLGPAVGYLLGGYFVESLYVDFDVVDVNDLNLSPEDPRFVGAWWVGFLATGCALFTVVLLLMCYPRELPSTKEVRLKRTVEVHQNESNELASQEGFGTTWRDMPKALKILLCNPVYMILNMAAICESLVVSSMATFMPKFIQNQFTLTAGFAAIIAGACAVPGAAGGQFGGGLICKLAKLQIRGMLRLNIIVSVVATVVVTVFFCRCSAPDFAGINVHYENITAEISDIDLNGMCNMDCGCTTLSYEPICGIDNVQYFSPCYAGCQNTVINGTKAFVNCTCIHNPVPDQDPVVMATEGPCDTECTLFYVFLPFFFVATFCVFLAAVPTLSVTLRCVPESQRAFAVGVQWVFVRLLGSIPGPILMGYVFDTTCVVWQKRCEEEGSCWLYNNKLLSERIVSLIAALKLVSVCFFVLAYIVYKPPPPQNITKTVSENKGSVDIAHAMKNMADDKTESEDVTSTSSSNFDPKVGFTNFGADTTDDSGHGSSTDTRM